MDAVLTKEQREKYEKALWQLPQHPGSRRSPSPERRIRQVSQGHSLVGPGSGATINLPAIFC